MKTKDAFKKLLTTPDIHLILGVAESHVRTWKTRLKTNKMSLEKMEAMLLKAGAKKVPEKWTFK